MMKFVFSMLMFLSYYVLFGTKQIPDKIIIDKDTFEILNPVSHIEFSKVLTEKIDKINKGWASSGCWRGYIATWKIIENKIYLLDIIKYKDKKPIKHLVEKTIGKKFIDGKLEVPNINEEFYCGLNPIWHPSDFKMMSEKEYKIKIENSIVTEKKCFAFNNCEYKYNNGAFLKHIYEQLVWSGWQGGNITVSITAIVDSTGIITSCERAEKEYYDGYFFYQLNNILLKMPCIQVYFSEGVFQPEINFKIQINDENKDKYTPLLPRISSPARKDL